MDKVSLYIPCFNAAGTIEKCLEGVFKQSYPIKEVIVVDDGSMDETASIVSRYPVRLIKNTDNRGLSASRNIAIKYMDTKFIASLDADCAPEPDWLECLMHDFGSGKTAGAGGKLLEDCSSVFDLWRSEHMKQYWRNDSEPEFLFGSNTVFRKDAITEVGFYNESYRNNYEDVDICKRLKKRGYSFIYDSKAVARHLKRDNISSVLESYWRWHLDYYKDKGWYSGQEAFILKLKDNIGLANRYMQDDISSGRPQLAYLDFFLAIHHSMMDLKYFFSLREGQSPPCLSESKLLQWLSLLDLTFFLHLGSSEDKLMTLMPKDSYFLQNIFTIFLLSGSSLEKIFNSEKLQKALQKHLLLSICKIEDVYMLEKMVTMVALHRDWEGLFIKSHPYLDRLFLKNFFSFFRDWLGHLKHSFPNIIQVLEFSAEQTGGLVN